MGFSVQYPKDWMPTPATQLWLPSVGNFWDDPVGDRLESPTAGFRGTSQALASGQSAEAWLTEYLGSEPACGVPEQVAVAGSTGTLGMNGCGGQGRLGGRVFDFVVVFGGRGYNFTMEGAVDHALFMAMLATVKFTPGSAATPTPSG